MKNRFFDGSEHEADVAGVCGLSETVHVLGRVVCSQVVIMNILWIKIEMGAINLIETP
jgi:hypothetical protein